jgi:hypothetical protein
VADEQTPCERDGHDYEFVAEGHYDGSRPGYVYDEFYCRRCLERVAVSRENGQKVVNPDPTWFHRRAR